MLVIGLTGGIGMGKSTAARILAAQAIPVFDADRAVHRLQARGGGAVAAIALVVPEAEIDGAIARPVLREAIRRRPELLGALERILHPMVGRERERFLARARGRGRRIAVLDVPLLFETGGDHACDLTITVSAPRPVQLARIRARGSMSREDAERLIARQMGDVERRRRADVVVRTGLSRFHGQAQLRRLLARLRTQPARLPLH